MTRILQATTPADLSRALANLDITVPPRSEGRTKEHTERYALAYLLSSLPPDRLPFPLSVTHADRPDFILSGLHYSIGVEHTEAVPQNEAHAQVIRESGVGPRVRFMRRAEPGEPVKGGRRLRQEVAANEMGSVWMGDSPEREWADVMLRYAVEKTPKATASGFKRCDLNWLLVYDNWPVPAVDHAIASTYLSDRIASTSVLGVFDSVFVVDSKYLCEFRAQHLLHPAMQPSVDG